MGSSHQLEKQPIELDWKEVSSIEWAALFVGLHDLAMSWPHRVVYTPDASGTDKTFGRNTTPLRLQWNSFSTFVPVSRSPASEGQFLRSSSNSYLLV
jgi:hypothetical protein